MSVKKCPKQTFEYVDLGLPSGTLWATCNVGAKSDIDFGDYLSFEEAQEFNCPTKEQIDEIIVYTTSLWINKEGVNGLLFIGQNQKYIFLPASGYRWNTDIGHVGDYGYYWSSTPYSRGADDAYCLYFRSGCKYWYYCSYCSCDSMFPVRPVKNK